MAGGFRGRGLSTLQAAAGGRAWLALAMVLALGALAVALAGGAGEGGGAGAIAGADAAAGAGAGPAVLRHALDWQPGRQAAEPWRLWTAAWVHLGIAHLAFNLAAALGIGALGRIARRPAADALAWAIAWPLTHLLLDTPFGSAIAASSLPHYGGLSGVLHAGVVVLALGLAWPARASVPLPSGSRGGASAAAGTRADARLRARERRIGLALLAGVLAKLLLEAPWGAALRADALLGIAVAPLAHACGAAAGAAAWAAVAAARNVLGRR